MNEPKPRLLPFRLRRRDARRLAPADFRGGEALRADDAPADAELRRLLLAWRAPAPGAELRARLAESFRAQAAPPPRWRRLLTARLSVPVPVAACAAAALVLSAVALAALAGRSPRASTLAAEAAAGVRLVESPAPPERVVTRVVYVEREARPAGARPAPPRKATPAAPAPARPADGDPTSYFTGLDMAEFRPADELKIRVIKRARPEEEQERKGR